MTKWYHYDSMIPLRDYTLRIFLLTKNKERFLLLHLYSLPSIRLNQDESYMLRDSLYIKIPLRYVC